MADANLPASPAPTLAMPMGGDGASLTDRLKSFAAQPAIRRSLPALAGLGTLAGVAALYMTLADGPSRVLYSSLSDAERAGVVSTLEAGAIDYDIDPATGMVSVAEDDLYRARMLVASDGTLANPDSTSEMLDAIPLGSSRTLEGERLRNVRERELMRTIQEINGVESVRVHLASPERSVFVRENVAPSASVMLRLARGRTLSPDQVQAIVNLVAGSVPGLSPSAVRVVDQSGRLLSDTGGNAGDDLQLQREFEEKLRLQVSQLLTPMLGEGNFSSQVQVELDLTEMTQARESYDNDGVVRSVSESRSVTGGEQVAGGIPGATANMPPDQAVLEQGPPQGNAAQTQTMPQDGQTSSQRTYELGREVAVTSTRPGGVRRISVAVALSEEALQAIQPATAEQVQQLVSAAVGADPQRGDQVTVIAGAFGPVEEDETPFYDTSWFAMALRYGSALIALLLGLLLGVRPIINALRGPESDGTALEEGEEGGEGGVQVLSAANGGTAGGAIATRPEDLREQVELARRLAEEQPDRAVAALRRMLAAPAPESAS
ncbi:flagellar basal-body MS-ring/collar protein FliF [Alteraurantiacibacter aquimixticola]|uniref:Flagellar M-ring protein n=1 Tax=Alteraurantiacibacter aquimixticola TaxID=2489173 RepID=A0A4T3F303_9SPHN|nr:flagellar basal-body MS-ring/collar protein FliF [Alteraurantiacibacter aquimixticola]TIX51528.1 flagellar M-ring protein FliF [Alteraurantiacibacter aquimixticola]